MGVLTLKHIKNFVIISIMLIIFCSCGKNINMSGEDVHKSLYVMTSYECIAQIKVITNKNERVYTVRQYFKHPNKFKVEVIDPKEIKGFKTIYDGINLYIYGAGNNQEQLLKNYSSIYDNKLFLSDFMSNYLKCEKSQITKDDKNIRLTTTVMNQNNYMDTHQLVIDKTTGLPKELNLFDVNKSLKMGIVYIKFISNPRLDDKIFKN